MKNLQLPETVAETIKELLRVIILAVISYLLVNNEVVGKLIYTYLDGKLGADGAVIFVGAAFAILRALDKFMHEVGKKNDNAILTGGLTRF